MRASSLFLLVCFGLQLSPCVGLAQVRSNGMAGSGSAIIEGIDATTLNPARLSTARGTTLRIVDSFGAVSNNSFALADYRSYNGASLSQADEAELLAKISDEALEVDGLVQVRGPAYRYRDWALTTTVLGAADASLPKEMLRLILDGNSPGETFSLDGTSGTSLLLGALVISHGRLVELPHLGPVSVGGSIKLIRGWVYAAVEEATGDIRTEIDGVEGEGRIRARTATGGSGFGFDLGFHRRFGDDWSASLVINDLLSSVKWNRGTKESIALVTVEEMTLEEIEDGQDLVLTEDDSYSIPSFRTPISPSLTAGAAHEFGRWVLVADWTQGFSETVTTTLTPRFAVGTEVHVHRWIDLRAGGSVGGVDRHSLALGLGLSPAFFKLDFALVARNGYLPLTGRGVGIGIGVGLDL